MQDSRESKCLSFSAFIVEDGFCPIREDNFSNIGRGFQVSRAQKGQIATTYNVYS